ncbi:MAG: hypothetical protein NUV32_01880 [Exilispira sp.]|jgi:hypothetical protein|nr:hypothetical protein [Exilispira sp.]
MAKYIENSGDSFENAIVILDAKDPTEGVEAEYKYIESKFGRQGKDWKLAEQKLIEKDGKFYDEILIRYEIHKFKKIFFDITSFYFKYLDNI